MQLSTPESNLEEHTNSVQITDKENISVHRQRRIVPTMNLLI